jgi:D-alanine transaminase
MTIAYLNGKFLPLEHAHISVLDRGFIFGDGVYEVIPVYAGKTFRLQEHLQRLERSLAGIALSNPLTRSEWESTIETLIAHNGGGDQSIYLHVTRGVAPRNHNFPAEIKHTIFLMSQPFKDPEPSPGAAAVTTVDNRWQRCDIKAISLLSNVLLRQHAVEQGAVESILIRDGWVTEGAASNVFIVEQGVVITPPEGAFILTGVTRDLILEVLQAAQLPCRVAGITEQRLRQAQEIWVTSSTREIIPIITLDSHPVGDGKRGAVWETTWNLFQAYKKKLRQINQ